MSGIPINLQETYERKRVVIDGGDDFGKPDLFGADPEGNLPVHGFEKSFGVDLGAYSIWTTCHPVLTQRLLSSVKQGTMLNSLEKTMEDFIPYARRAGLLFAPAEDNWNVDDPERKYAVYVSDFGRGESYGKKGLVAIAPSNGLRMLFENKNPKDAEKTMRDYLKENPRVTAINLIGLNAQRISDFTWDAYVLERKD